MTHTTQIQLFQIFRQKFGEKDAEVIVETLEQTVDNKMEATKNTFLTKDDKVEIIREMKADKEELINMQIELIKAIKDTKIAIKDSKIDTIKWMAGMFLTLAMMIIGLYLRK